MLIHVYIDERPGRIRLGLSHLIPRVVRWCKVTEERKGFYNPAQPSQQTYSVWLCIDSGFNYTTKIYTGNLLSKRLLFTTYLWNINCFLRQTRVCWGRGLQLPKLLLNDIFEVWCYMFFFFMKREVGIVGSIRLSYFQWLWFRKDVFDGVFCIQWCNRMLYFNPLCRLFNFLFSKM